MKYAQTEPEFKPLTITIESSEELRLFRRVVATAYWNYSDSREDFAKEILDEIGWGEFDVARRLPDVGHEEDF